MSIKRLRKGLLFVLLSLCLENRILSELRCVFTIYISKPSAEAFTLVSVILPTGKVERRSSGARIENTQRIKYQLYSISYVRIMITW